MIFLLYCYASVGVSLDKQHARYSPLKSILKKGYVGMLVRTAGNGNEPRLASIATP